MRASAGGKCEESVPEGGSYLLFLSLLEAKDIEVGCLGQVHFPGGSYIYTGSAMGGLDARVARHLKGGKKVHWHIDHLRRWADPEGAILIRSQERMECMINELVESLEGTEPFAPGFGCSDCGCVTHLHRLSKEAKVHLRDFFSGSSWIDEGSRLVPRP